MPSSRRHEAAGESQRTNPRDGERVGDDVNQSRPEVKRRCEHGGAVADAGDARNEDERGEDNEIFDRIRVRGFHSTRPCGLRLWGLRVADCVGNTPYGDAIEYIRNPHQAGERRHQCEVRKFWLHRSYPPRSNGSVEALCNVEHSRRVTSITPPRSAREKSTPSRSIASLAHQLADCERPLRTGWLADVVGTRFRALVDSLLIVVGRPITAVPLHYRRIVAVTSYMTEGVPGRVSYASRLTVAYPFPGGNPKVPV